MSDVRRLYRRLDDWTRALSRGQYAVLVGLVSGAAVFAVGLLGEPTTFQAVAMGVTMTVLYYALDPNEER